MTPVSYRFPLPVARRLLQSAIAIGGLVPVLAGLAGIVQGPGMVGPYDHMPISLDSHFRYLSGLLLGLGLGFWSTIPHIENNASRFRFLTAIVFIGGIGRLWSLLTMGTPSGSMIFGLVMELGITPLIALWQHRLTRSYPCGDEL